MLKHCFHALATSLLVLSLASCATNPNAGYSYAAEPARKDESVIVAADDSAYQTTSELMYEIMVGELAGKLGDLEQSKRHYALALEQTDDPDIIERVMRVAIFAKDWSLALHAAKRWAQVQPERIEAQQVLGVLHLRTNNIDAAEASFLQVMNAASDSPRQGFSIVINTLSQVHDVQNSLTLMGRLVAHYYTNPYGHLAYANLAMGAGEYRLAVDESELAIGFKPDLTKARVLRARALNALGDHDLAIQEMRDLVNADPANYEQRMGYAQMLLQAQELLPAASQFEILLAERPDDSTLVYMLGLTYMQAEEYPQARQYFQDLVDDNRRLDESYYYLGLLAEEMGDIEQAQEMLLQVAFGEWFLEASMRLATIYLRTDSIAKARQHLKSVRADLSSPESVMRIYLAEGNLLSQEKHFQLAYEVYSQGLLEFPKHFDLLYARAITSDKMDRVDLFEADMRSIIEANPEHVDALNALGYTLADRGLKLAEAKQLIERAYALNPQDAAIIDSMGWIYFRLGNYAESEGYLRLAVDKMYDPEIVGHLIELLRAKGDTHEAETLLKQASERFPNDQYLDQLQQSSGQ